MYLTPPLKRSPNQPDDDSRRTFLRRSAQLTFTGMALPTLLNLSAMGQAAAMVAPDGSYKALVCVFMYGGNDYANTVVTYDDPSYNLYSTIRGGGAGQTAGGIALAKAALTPTLLTPTTALPDGRQYAFHPSMTGLAALFNAGKVAVQLNVGPLVKPMTKAQYKGTDRTQFPVPPKLFSHNDQQSLWQSSSPEGSTIGWGGNVGDLALQFNSNRLFTCISVTGNAVFLAGDAALSYQVSSGGAVKIKAATDQYTYGSTLVKNAMLAITQQTRSHVLENEYNKVTQRAIGAELLVTAALTSAAAVDTTAAPNPNFAPFNAEVLRDNSLASQLKIVARLIAGRGALGSPKRQVFFVSLGGFDLHDDLVVNHVRNMRRVNDAMTAFYQSTELLGVASSVTTFTASDFGRTLSSNGDGSDHGWGSHHLVMGGAVKGAAFYGTAPPVSTSDTTAAADQWHVGQGRLLPTTSVDQYAATLATWFGVEEAELSGANGILPNLANFNNLPASAATGNIAYPRNLGFMNAP